MTIKALIFDFDGLLMDTESTPLASWRWEWQRHGLELDPVGFFADHGGDANESRYAALAAAVGRAYDRRSSHALRMAYRAGLNAALGPAPGIVGWLDRAAELELRLAVASSSLITHVGAMLGHAGLRARFEVLATGDEVAAHKPDPAGYLLALDRLGLRAQEAVAFEDTAHGVTGAHAAGLRCVAVPNQYVERARFAAADLLLQSAADLCLDGVLAALSGRAQPCYQRRSTTIALIAERRAAVRRPTKPTCTATTFTPCVDLARPRRCTSARQEAARMSAKISGRGLTGGRR